MTTKLEAAARQTLEHVQEFKRRWWQVPAFGNKVNKATREAITNAHSPIFELEHAIREALAEQASEPDWKAEAVALRVNEQNLIAALEAEREAIAQFFEQHYRDRWTDVEIVEAIRARSTT